MFAMKWQGGGTPASVAVDFYRLPRTAQAPAEKLLSALGADAPWVEGPLQHAALCSGGFRKESFAHLIEGDGPKNFSRAGWLDGLAALAKKYPSVSSVLWDTIAIMGLRPSPHVEERIPNLGDMLRHDWGVSDATLHAAAKATAFWADICHELAAHSGCYAEHGCGCDHIVRELPSGATFPAMPADRYGQTTREFWEHFLSELALIYVYGFPFALNEDADTRYAKTLVNA